MQKMGVHIQNIMRNENDKGNILISLCIFSRLTDMAMLKLFRDFYFISGCINISYIAFHAKFHACQVIKIALG